MLSIIANVGTPRIVLMFLLPGVPASKWRMVELVEFSNMLVFHGGGVSIIMVNFQKLKGRINRFHMFLPLFPYPKGRPVILDLLSRNLEKSKNIFPRRGFDVT